MPGKLTSSARFVYSLEEPMLRVELLVPEPGSLIWRFHTYISSLSSQFDGPVLPKYFSSLNPRQIAHKLWSFDEIEWCRTTGVQAIIGQDNSVRYLQRAHEKSNIEKVAMESMKEVVRWLRASGVTKDHAVAVKVVRKYWEKKDGASPYLLIMESIISGAIEGIYRRSWGPKRTRGRERRATRMEGCDGLTTRANQPIGTRPKRKMVL